MKILKWILITAISLLVLIALYLTLILDINDAKPKLIEVVKQQTGRELVIDSDLNWTIYPALGIELAEIVLSQPDNIDADSMLKVKRVVAEVELLPLLSQQVEISKLNLDGLTVNMIISADGSSSLDGLNTENGKPDEPTTQVGREEGGFFPQLDLNIAGVSITNTQVNIINEQRGTEKNFILESLQLGQFSLDKFAPISYQLKLNTEQLQLASQGDGQVKVDKALSHLTLADLTVTNNISGDAVKNAPLTVSVDSDIQLSLEKKWLDVGIKMLTVNDIKAQGAVKVGFTTKIPKLDLSLNFDHIDLNPYLAQETDVTTNKESKQVQPSQQEPDLSGLGAVDGDIKLSAKSIKVDKLDVSDWSMKLNLNSGVASLTRFTAKLFGGELDATGRLDGRKPIAKYQFTSHIKEFDIQTILRDFAQTDVLAGKTDINIKGEGSSLIVENIKRNIVMRGDFNIADGALYGVNIPHMIRQAKAKIEGDMSTASVVEQKTDFTSLTGSFKLVKGTVTNRDLLMQSPLIRLTGAGEADIVKEKLSYKLATSVVGTLEGQGGDKRDTLYGIEIPLTITGPFNQPKFALDTEALFDAKIKQETDKLEKKLTDSLLKRLGGF